MTPTLDPAQAQRESPCNSWEIDLSLLNSSITDTIIDGQRVITIDLTVSGQDTTGCLAVDLGILLDSTVSSSQIELDLTGSWLGTVQELSSGFDYDENNHELFLDVSRLTCTGKIDSGAIVTILISGYEGVNPDRAAQFLGNDIVIMIDNIDA